MAQGVVLMLIAVAVAGHLTLGNRARWLAEIVTPGDPTDSEEPTTATAVSTPTSTASRPRWANPDYGDA